MNEMVYQDEEKEALYRLAKDLLEQVIKWIPNSVQEGRLLDLLSDMESEFHTVVVLGEFKRGKSTFMNAMLGQSLLPVDVTPTTATINALMWGKEPSLQIHHSDESISDVDLSEENLQKYIADSDFDPQSVNYLKITLPDPLLKDNIVFIDTPGVEDINEQRVEVTYNFIPRADTVIFLIDGTSPVKRTEYEFLTETLLEQGLDRILFVVNFIDELDDEEEEEIIEMVKRRLGSVIDHVENKVIPFSAWQALEGKLTGDPELLEESRLSEVEQAVHSHIQTGSLAKEKKQRYRVRLQHILAGAKRELESLIQIYSYSEEEVKERLTEITKQLDRFESIQRELLYYVEDREAEINVMVEKSLKHFGESLIQDLLLSIDQYQGLDIKDYVENQVPLYIKNRLKQWIEQYSGPIHKLFQMLEKEIAIGLASEFNASITKLNIRKEAGLLTKDQSNHLEISADDISNTPIIAGLIAGGAGTLAMILGGPVLLPIFGMAGYPLIQKQLMTKKLEEAKEKLKPELESCMQEVLNQFHGEVKDYVSTNIKAIREAAEGRYQELVGSMEEQLRDQEKQQQASQQEQEKQTMELKKALQQVQGSRLELESL